jgi:hypothetical protein
MSDILLRGMASRGLPVDVTKIESCSFAVMVVFMIYCYSVEPDNMVKSYYAFLNTLFHPLPTETTVLQIYKDEAARLFPLNKSAN